MSNDQNKKISMEDLAIKVEGVGEAFFDFVEEAVAAAFAFLLIVAFVAVPVGIVAGVVALVRFAFGF